MTFVNGKDELLVAKHRAALDSLRPDVIENTPAGKLSLTAHLRI
jgi:hypothetical protein